jgi:hypothetical protein
MIGLSAWLWYLPYEAFKAWALQLAQNDLLAPKVDALIGPHRYSWIQWASVGATVLSAVATFYINRYLRNIIQYLNAVYQYIIDKIKAHQKLFSSQSTAIKGAFWVLWCFTIIRSVYHAYHFDLQYDEAWTFVTHSKNGIFFSAVAPHNNHILYSMHSALFHQLGLSTWWSIRLPVLLYAVGLLYLTSFFLMQQFKPWAAWFGTAFLSLSGAFTYFSFLGRGYMPAMFFALLSLWVLSHLVRGEQDRVQGGLFIASSVLAAWSLPTQVIFTLAIGLVAVLWQWSDRRSLKYMLGLGLGIGAGLLLVIGPSLLAGALSVGEQAVGGASKAFNLGALGHYCIAVLQFQVWVPHAWPLLLMLGLTVLLGFGRGKRVFATVAAWGILFSMPFVVLISGVYMPERVWAFMAIPLSILCAGLIQRFNALQRWFALAFLVTVFYYGEWSPFIRWSVSLDRSSRLVAQRMLDEGMSRYYSNFDYIKPIASVYAHMRGKSIEAVLQGSQSINGVEDLNDLDDLDGIVYHAETPVEKKEYSEIYRDTVLVLLRKEK